MAAHGLAAMRWGPHWSMPKEEATEHARAWGNVLRWYSISATQKALDHLTLAGVLGFAYTPRFGMNAAHRMAQRRGANQRQGTMPSGTVYHFTGPPPPPGTPGNGSAGLHFNPPPAAE